MRRGLLRKLMLTVCVVVASLTSGVAPAAASKPMTVTGNFVDQNLRATPFRTADRNTFYAETYQIIYTGDLTGTTNNTDTLIVYKDGSFKGVGVEVCNACILGGRTGGYTAVFTYRGTPTGQFEGHLAFIHSTGGLAGLHGEGTFGGNEVVNTYSYNYSFAP
jgi:hypothetical protein